MNKYSSKAIKTAATVGMSLAMVLSNAAPVFAEQTAGVCADATNTTETCGRDLYLRISDALADEGIEFADVQMDAGVTITIDDNGTGDDDKDSTDQDIIRTIYTYRTALSAYRTSSSTSTAIYREIGTWLTAIDQIAEKMGDFTDLNAETATETEVAALSGTVQGYATNVDTPSEGWLDANGEITNSVSITAAKAALSAMNTFENRGYYNYMSDVMQDYFSNVKSNIEIALGDNIETSDEQMVAFVEAFDKILQNDLDGDPTTLTDDEQGITGYGETVQAVNLSSRSALRARINKIQNADLYDDLENEDAVIAIIDAYQELLDNLGDLSTILTSDAYVAYTRTKTDDADETVRSYVLRESSAKFGGADINTAAKALAEVKKIADGLDSEQWAVLADLKADVLDLVFNFSTRQIGNYYTDRGAFVDNATASQKSTITANVPGALLKVVDTETGEFGIDYLAAYMEDVADALAAVTTDIEALTPANITAADKALLEAAEDALFDLQYEGKYVENLTTAQAREVRRAVSKITNLREAFDNLGVTNVAGWYSMGNGNWGYNNEDGTPAAYRWVASGSDWYMIRNGVMLRNTWIATDGGRWYYVDNAGKMVTNQSVDGCWINSYGIYMSPSYNG